MSQALTLRLYASITDQSLKSSLKKVSHAHHIFPRLLKGALSYFFRFSFLVNESISSNNVSGFITYGYILLSAFYFFLPYPHSTLDIKTFDYHSDTLNLHACRKPFSCFFLLDTTKIERHLVLVVCLPTGIHDLYMRSFQGFPHLFFHITV